MFGLQDEGVFSSIENAQRYIKTRGPKGKPEVIQTNILGDMEEPNKIFTASWYDRPHDIHHFKGVYGTYEEAKKAAGEQGLVLNREINDRLS